MTISSASPSSEAVSGQSPVRAGQIDNLTTLRFVAAFSIFLHHLSAFEVNAAQFMWNMNLGWTVSFFFVLSGFVLSYSYHGRLQSVRDAGPFIITRFFRLWPLHLVCGVAALLLFAPVLDPGKLYLFLTLQHAWLPSYDTGFFVNAVSWSISVELFFYIVFPFVLIAGTRTVVTLFVALYALVVAALLFVSAFPELLPFAPASETGWYAPGVTARSFFFFFPPVRLVEFLAGMVVFEVMRRRRLPDAVVPWAQLAAIVAIILYMMVHQGIVSGLTGLTSRLFAVSYGQYGMFPLFALVIYAFAHQSGPISRVLSFRPFVYLGEISFSFYLIHQIVIRFFARTLSWQTTNGALGASIIAFVVSVALSILLFTIVERPALNWAKTTVTRRLHSESDRTRRRTRWLPQVAVCAAAIVGLVVAGSAAIEVARPVPPVSAKAQELAGLTLDEAMAGLTQDENVRGYVDQLRVGDQVQISGWAVDDVAPEKPVSVVAYAGDKHIGAVVPGWPRADIPNLPTGALIAFTLTAAECPTGALLRVFAVTDDGRQAELKWWNLEASCP